MVGDLFRYNGIDGDIMYSPVLYNLHDTTLVFTDRDVEYGTDPCMVRNVVLFGFIKEGSLMNRNSLWGKEVSWM